MDIGPAEGVVANGVHHFPVRVYFEDTDFSGVVYHASYLRFMERARSDLLARVGVDQRARFDADGAHYAVADLQIRYLRPARMGDALTVVTRCLRAGAALMLRQDVCRGGERLTTGDVRVGFLAADGRPQRQPAAWLAAFRALVAADGAAERTTDGGTGRTG